MMESREYYVEGYCFSSVEDVKQAKQERKQAEYFEKKLEGRNAPGMLAAYDKILERKVFSTPVGWAYLQKLQERLRLMGIEEEKIRPIPVLMDFSRSNKEEKSAERRKIFSEKKQNREKISFFFNILLAVLVIVMFAISLSSDNPNILNYKQAVLNEYASWEQELRQRENDVRRKEAELQEAAGGAADDESTGAPAEN